MPKASIKGSFSMDLYMAATFLQAFAKKGLRLESERFQVHFHVSSRKKEEKKKKKKVKKPRKDLRFINFQN